MVRALFDMCAKSRTASLVASSLFIAQKKSAGQIAATRGRLRIVEQDVSHRETTLTAAKKYSGTNVSSPEKIDGSNFHRRLRS
jgi:hypothetical protein